MAIVSKRFKLRVQKPKSDEDVKLRDKLKHRKHHLRKRLLQFGTENSPAYFSCHNGFKLPYEMSYTQFADFFIIHSKKFYLERIPCKCNICDKIFGYSKKKEWRN